MKKTVTLMIITATLSLLGLYQPVIMAMAPSNHNFASAIDDIQAGANTANPTGPTVDRAIQVGVNIFSLIVGIASVVMVIYGGFKFITAAGDPNSIAGAKRTVIYSMIGLTLASLSQLIMRIVVGRASSV